MKPLLNDYELYVDDMQGVVEEIGWEGFLLLLSSLLDKDDLIQLESIMED